MDIQYCFTLEQYGYKVQINEKTNEHDDYSTWTVFDNGELVATIIYSTMDEQNQKVAYLDSMKVENLYRNKGIGSIILNSLCEHLKHKGCARIGGRVSSDDVVKGIRFYKKNGWEIHQKMRDGEISKML